MPRCLPGVEAGLFPLEGTVLTGLAPVLRGVCVSTWPESPPRPFWDTDTPGLGEGSAERQGWGAASRRV